VEHPPTHSKRRASGYRRLVHPPTELDSCRRPTPVSTRTPPDQAPSHSRPDSRRHPHSR
jgi:hypothetical protein